MSGARTYWAIGRCAAATDCGAAVAGQRTPVGTGSRLLTLTGTTGRFVSEHGPAVPRLVVAA